MKRAYLSIVEEPHTGSPLTPLIQQEALSLLAAECDVPIMHIWRHERAVLLGPRDAGLAAAHAGISQLTASGFAVAVRPFGGLAVPLDAGVLNVSMILPGLPPLDDCFSQLAKLLTHACAPLAVSQGEVAGSYCPGRYDLAVQGKKIAGIAQRRIARAVVVSAFLNVSKSTYDREMAIREFYAAALPPATENPIMDGRVGCLADSLGDITYGKVVDRIVSAVQDSGVTLSSSLPTWTHLLAKARQRIAAGEREWSAQDRL